MILVKLGITFVVLALALFGLFSSAYWGYKSTRRVWSISQADPAAFKLYTKSFLISPFAWLDRGVRETTDVIFELEALDGQLIDPKTFTARGRPGLAQYRFKVSKSSGEDVVKNLNAVISFPFPVFEADVETSGSAVGLRFGPNSQLEGGSIVGVGNFRKLFPGRMVFRQYGVRANELSDGTPASVWVVLDHRPAPPMGDDEPRPRAPEQGFLLFKFVVETPDGEIEREIYQPLTVVVDKLYLGPAAPKPEKLQIYLVESESVQD